MDKKINQSGEMPKKEYRQAGSAKRMKKKKKLYLWRGLLLVIVFSFCAGSVFGYFLSGIIRTTPTADQPVSVTEQNTTSEEKTEQKTKQESGSDKKNQVSSQPKSEPEKNTENPVSKQAKEILKDMTLEEKIYQMFIVTQEQLTGYSGTVVQSGKTSQGAIQEKPVGGIIYFEPNLQSKSQVESMISNLQEASKLGLFISVDEEGGRVSRLGGRSDFGVTAFPSMFSVGKEGTEAAYRVGKTIGTEISGLGFNLDFAPVADVFNNSENQVIGERAFANNGADAATLVKAAVEGFKESKMLCTLKHFPGHGNTLEDSHSATAYVDKTLDELRAEELLPFKAGIDAGADFVMIGHLNLPQITKENVPATFSHEIVTDLLREELGFDGIVITDGMNMAAISESYNSGDAAVKAIKAGIDIILLPSSLDGAFSGVKNAVDDGTLTEERIDQSVLRILEVKLRQGIIEMK